MKKYNILHKERAKNLYVSITMQLAISVALFAFSISGYASKIMLNDVSRLNPVLVNKVVHVHTTNQLIKAVKEAQSKHLSISIAGKQHSQGGQTLQKNSIHLDMLPYNKVLFFNKKKALITVQSGTTWKIIQSYINPFNLAVKVMQSSNIFTVGGSASVNAHGRDPNFGPIISTIESFHLLLPNAKLIKVTPRNHPLLFRLAIGGYGLFGVITDLTFSLTANNMLSYHVNQTDCYKFDSLRKSLFKNNDVSLFFGRLSIAKNKSFLREMYVVSYINTHTLKKPPPLLVDMDKKDDLLYKPFFNFSRRSQLGKDIRWKLEDEIYTKIKSRNHKEVSRNNAMRPPIKFLTDYHSANNSDILQEYFIPTENFTSFVEKLKSIVEKFKVNLLNVTVRFEPKDQAAFLSYAHKDSYAIVIYINVELSKAGQLSSKQWTERLVQAAIANGGTYYLPYQLWPTKMQLLAVYPKMKEFCRLKKKYDPSLIFLNKFYVKYCDFSVAKADP